MRQEHPLARDLKREEAILQVLPSPPVATSKRFGWRGIELQRYRQLTWETPEGYLMHDMLVIIPPTNRATHSRRTLDTCQRDEPVVKGRIAIIPAHVLHKSSWEGEADFTLLILELGFLTRVAYESIKSDRIELLPTFAKHDPIIYQIGALLQNEIESNAANSQLYVDGLTTALSAHLLHQYCTVQQIIRDYEDGLPKYKLQQAIDYIHAHLAEDISLRAIATELNISQYYFCRLFKQSIGTSPHQYVTLQRIHRCQAVIETC
jgi:AraC family transcriptional regulator